MQAVALRAHDLAKKHKLASRGLDLASRKVKNKFFKKVLGGGARLASALGYANEVSSKNTQYRGKTFRPVRNQGGQQVLAAPAPIAFARTEDLKPVFEARRSDASNGMVVHTVDYVGPIGTASATPGTWQANLNQLESPANTTLHPWLASIAAQFLKYKLKRLRVHYQHFISTTVAGQVVLQYFPDPTYNNGTAATITASQSQNAGNFMSGAAYEDFCLDADLSAIDPSMWYSTPQSVGTSGTADLNFTGIIAAFTANAAGSQASTGNIWVEAVYEFCERKLSSVAVGLNELRLALELEMAEEKRYEIVKQIVAQMLKDAAASRIRASGKRPSPLANLEQKYCLSGSTCSP